LGCSQAPRSLSWYDLNEWFLKGLAQAQPPKDSDNDGLPDDWEVAHGLDPNESLDAIRIVNAGESSDDRHAGSSFLEFYLNELAENLVP